MWRNKLCCKFGFVSSIWLKRTQESTAAIKLNKTAKRDCSTRWRGGEVVEDPELWQLGALPQEWPVLFQVSLWCKSVPKEWEKTHLKRVNDNCMWCIVDVLSLRFPLLLLNLQEIASKSWWVLTNDPRAGTVCPIVEESASHVVPSTVPFKGIWYLAHLVIAKQASTCLLITPKQWSELAKSASLLASGKCALNGRMGLWNSMNLFPYRSQTFWRHNSP